MCPIKQVKHYFLTWAAVAKSVAYKMDIRTARVRPSQQLSVLDRCMNR